MAHPALRNASAYRHSICLILARWGGWPAWSAIMLRSMEFNPSVRFLVVGDRRPRSFRWPTNVEFHRIRLLEVARRAKEIFGRVPSRLTVAGGSSKISDFKPAFGHLFEAELRGCDFCPAAFHLRCLGVAERSLRAVWACPHHACTTCRRRSRFCTRR